MDALIYYSNPEVQRKILEIAKDREIAGSSEDGRFFSRPDTLVYPNDIVERVKKGIVAFHCSVEQWKNPMQLKSEIPKQEMNELRKGFDFIIDIDAKTKLKHAQIAAIEVVKFLREFNVEPTIKFSGSRGFHIGVAGIAFPSKIDFKNISERYPEIPRTLGSFIQEKCKSRILDALVKYEGGLSKLFKDVEISDISPYKNIIDIDEIRWLNPRDKETEDKIYTAFSDIEKNWGTRHLFRMPYSLHPKKWLISLPISFEQLKNFNIEMAKPENVSFENEFLVNKENEATNLLLKALDWGAKIRKEEIPKKEFKGGIKIKIPETHFPPCIKTILAGIDDGRKRSLFTLCSYLRAMNWTQEEIEKKIKDWNSDLARPLTDRTINTQLKWHFRQARELMPANCESDMFYKSMGICKPDNTCGKNPVNYPFNVYKKNKKVKNK